MFHHHNKENKTPSVSNTLNEEDNDLNDLYENCKCINIDTGLPTELKGEKLQEAKESGKVLPIGAPDKTKIRAYITTHRKRKPAESETTFAQDIIALLRGKDLGWTPTPPPKPEKTNNDTPDKTALPAVKKPVSYVTPDGGFVTEVGDALADAIKNRSAISYTAWLSRESRKSKNCDRNILVDSKTGNVVQLTPEELKIARKKRSVITLRRFRELQRQKCKSSETDTSKKIPNKKQKISDTTPVSTISAHGRFFKEQPKASNPLKQLVDLALKPKLF